MRARRTPSSSSTTVRGVATRFDLCTLTPSSPLHPVLIHGSLLSGEFVVASEPFHLARAVLEPAWKMLHMSPTASQKIKQLRLTREVAPELESQRMLGDSKRLIQILSAPAACASFVVQIPD